MRYQIGDAVRLKPGSDYEELLGPWSDLTATVGAVEQDGAAIALVFPEPFPGWTSILPAGEFVRDSAFTAEPF